MIILFAIIQQNAAGETIPPGRWWTRSCVSTALKGVCCFSSLKHISIRIPVICFLERQRTSRIHLKSLFIQMSCSDLTKWQDAKYSNFSNDRRGNITGLIGLLTHWGRDKMAANFLTTISNAFSWMKIYEFRLRFHWGLFVNHIPSLVQIMAWHRPGDKPLSESIMVSLTTHICAIRPQWVNMTMVWSHTWR